MARQYANFPKYSMPRALVNIISGNLPVLMLAPLFGLTEVGFIGMALTLSLSPIQIVVKSIYQVLYQHIAQRVNNRQPIGALMRRYIGNVLLVSVPFFIGLYFILPWLTEMLLGASWRMSGIYIRIFLPWILMITITTSINFIPDIFGKQSAMLWIEIVYLILRVIALAIGGYTASLVTALTLFSVSGVIVLLGQLVWFVVLTRHYDKDYEKCE
jgi:O-antigen/teichoic acid export membrane protein